MGIATLCCCGAASCSLAVNVSLSVTCGPAAGLNGTTVAVKSGGTTVATLTWSGGATSHTITFTGVPGTYNVVYTLPSPYGFTRTHAVTLACLSTGGVSDAFVLLLTCNPSIVFPVLLSANSFLITSDHAPGATLTNPGGWSGAWAETTGGYNFTPTQDIAPSSLAGTSVSATYKGHTRGASYASCSYPVGFFLDAVGVTTVQSPGCTAIVGGKTFTTHGITATSDANGDAVVTLTTDEDWNGTFGFTVTDDPANPCVYNVCVP